MGTFLIIAAVCFFAATVAAVTGFGTSTIMVPIVLLFLPFRQALLLVGIIHWTTDVWRMILFRTGWDRKLVLGFGIAGVVASFAGAALTFDVPEAVLERTVGIAIVAYVVFAVFRPAFKVRKTKGTAIGGGALYGFVAGITGVGGVVRTAALNSFDLPKTVYLFTAAIVSFAVDGARTSTYFLGGTRLSPVMSWGLLAFIPIAFAATLFGKRIVDRIPQKAFRNVILVVLFVFGLKLAVFPG